MVVIYRIISTIAAVLIILIGGTWIAKKNDIDPIVGWWDHADQADLFSSYFDRSREEDGVPATSAGEISIPIEPGRRRGAPWQISNEASLVLPVFFGDNRFNESWFFSHSTYGDDGRYAESGGSCRDDLVNLLVIDNQHPAGRLVFERRVLLPKVFYIEQGEYKHIAALVVSSDTNGDGKLDCGDSADFQVVSLNDGAVEVADRQFVPDNIISVRFNFRDNMFTLSEVISGPEDVSIKSIKISWDDLSVSEVLAPDLISGAQAAFNNVAVE